MKSLKNLKIGQRLVLGFLLVSAISLYLAGLGKYNFSDLAEQAENITKDTLIKVQMIFDLKENSNALAHAAQNLASKKNGDGKEGESRRIAEIKSSSDNLISKFKGMRLIDDEHAMLKKVIDMHFLYVKHLEKLGDSSARSDGTNLDQNFLKDLEQSQLDYSKSIDALYVLERQKLQSGLDQLKDDASTDSSWFIVVALGGVLLGLTVAWFIAKSITEPIRESINIAQKIAAGNLSTNIQTERLDESGDLIRALKSMNDSLSHIVGQVRNSGEKVVAEAGNVANAGQNLSQRTEEQAASLEQTASAMEQLASAVKKNTDTALQAYGLAPMSIEAARAGGQAVDQVIGTIEDISASSQQMSSIIGVIDAIAFQTNILSLNAAVEAARAGEQGKGFAVVATEVRMLAQRSANAAREIKDLISSNVAKVHAGTKQVEVAKVGMKKIVDQVTKVGVLITEISTSSQQQSAGITEISSAVSQLDRVTQQNALLVEKNATAAKDLKSEANELLRSVSTFKLA